MKQMRIALAALAAVLPATGSQAQKYAIADLGSVNGASEVRAAALNASNIVVGQADATAFRWTGFGMADIGNARFDFSFATGINDKGFTVGGVGKRIPAEGGDILLNYAFRTKGLAIDPLKDLLPPLNGNAGAVANAINSSGQVAGTSANGPILGFRGGNATATLWDANGVPKALAGIEGLPAEALAINNKGEAAGGVQTFDGNVPVIAAIWKADGTLLTYPPLPGDTAAEAQGINDNREIVGGSSHGINGRPGAFVSHAFLLDAKGKMQDLGTPGVQFIGATALGINNFTRVVGTAWTQDALNQTLNAFVWQAGNMFNLNSLIPADSGWTLESATAINNNGAIVGFGVHNGDHRAFLLIPPKKRFDLHPVSRIAISPPLYNTGTGTWDQQIEATNQSGDFIAGPFLFELTPLPNGVTLANATGMSHQKPQLLLDLPAVAPGGTISATFQFRARDPKLIDYHLRFFSGTGEQD